MNESQNIEQMRMTLYEEVWSEPVTTVAARYGLSDNGLRKRCKALNIPLPPAGYWAKVKAGKPVPDRTPLPSTVFNNDNQIDKSDGTKSQPQKKERVFHLIDSEELSLEQLTTMHDFDLLVPGSLETFLNWCKSLTVPSRIHNYHDLVSRHQSEMEYREARDKEHPLRDEGIRLWRPVEKVKYRDNEAVIPIDVSSRQYNRECRIVDTILKAFQELKARFSVERGNKDNITITILSSEVSFELLECKTKLRHIIDQRSSQDFRPLYEKIFNGKFQINWTTRKVGYYSSDNSPTIRLSFSDESDNPLENQIPAMVLEVCRLCCNNEILNMLEQKERAVQFEQEKNKRLEKEHAEKQKKLEEKRQAHKDNLINDLTKHAESWFTREMLLRYADELENYLITCKKDETVQLLQKYIQLVRENADKCNPLNHILVEMRAIELPEDG